MNPSVARALVIMLSFVVLGASAIVTILVWSLLSPLQPLPRGVLSLVAWVSAYYVGTNFIFWRGVVRISPDPFSQRP
ncbi:MAG TPA: hypothetical protein VEO75_01260 [Nitrososphaerales archaeon]|nr:hypothetical protein [Nitrososphaerales archaeon]